jgi:hypothetical protein
MREARRIIAITALLSFVACSNGSDGPAVGAAFARRAVAACNDAKGLKDAQGPFPYPDFNPTDPDPTMFPGVADALMKTDVTFTTWLEEMRALGEPPSGTRRGPRCSTRSRHTSGSTATRSMPRGRATPRDSLQTTTRAWRRKRRCSTRRPMRASPSAPR